MLSLWEEREILKVSKVSEPAFRVACCLRVCSPLMDCGIDFQHFVAQFGMQLMQSNRYRQNVIVLERLLLSNWPTLTHHQISLLLDHNTKGKIYHTILPHENKKMSIVRVKNIALHIKCYAS